MKKFLLPLATALTIAFGANAAVGDSFEYTYEGQKLKYVITNELQKRLRRQRLAVYMEML